jgi:hypothetical protein
MFKRKTLLHILDQGSAQDWQDREGYFNRNEPRYLTIEMKALQHRDRSKYLHGRRAATFSLRTDGPYNTHAAIPLANLLRTRCTQRFSSGFERKAEIELWLGCPRRNMSNFSVCS